MDDPLQRLTPKYGSPRLWIERVWLYAELKPLRQIREVKLQPGINVIWARERELQPDEDLLAYGHGVGKTSFCRLLRYCLGEDSFGDPDHEERVRSAFPRGAVVALLHLADEAWCVLRPFGKHRTSHAVQGKQPQILLSTKSDQNPYSNFHQRLDSFFLAALPTELPGSRTPVRWAHLLAWCTRDQEAHLSSYTSWRGGESVNASAGFRRPAQDPPNLIKAALGILPEEESKLLDEQYCLQKELEGKKQKIEVLEREPHYWHQDLQSRLKGWLKTKDDLPVRSPDLFGASLIGTVQQHLALSAKREKDWQGDLEKIDRDLVPLADDRLLLTKEIETLTSILDYLSGKAEEFQEEIDRPRKERERLLNHRGVCELGWVDFQQCQNILNRLSVLDLRDPKEIQVARKCLADAAGDASSVSSKLKEYEGKLEKIQSKIEAMEKQRRALNLRLATSELERKTIQENLEKLLEYDDIVEGKKGHSDLTSSRMELGNLERKLKRISDSLLLKKYMRSEAECTIEKLWTACVRKVVAKTARGRFKSSDGNRPFRLLSHSGRAIRALEVLLGDWVGLLHSIAGEGKLPGFLMHDCPREADMSPGLYRNFLEAIAEWQTIFAKQGSIPFQYILTTTSPPPKSLQKSDFLRLELDAELDERLFFKTRLGTEEIF